MFVASIVVEVETASVSRSIERNTKVYLEYEVPREGFTVKAEVDMGSVAVCGSRSLARPDCSYSPTYDWMLEVNDYSEIFINGEGFPGNEHQSISKHQIVESINITIFVTVEGLDSLNSFSLNTTYGDTTLPGKTPWANRANNKQCYL